MITAHHKFIIIICLAAPHHNMIIIWFLAHQGPVPQNFPKSISKFLPKLTFTNLKYSRWILWRHAFDLAERTNLGNNLD